MELSPAYDINLEDQPLGSQKQEHFLAVNGKHDGITRVGLLQEAERFSVGGVQAILAAVRTAVERWSEFPKEAGLSLNIIEELCKEHKLV